MVKEKLRTIVRGCWWVSQKVLARTAWVDRQNIFRFLLDCYQKRLQLKGKFSRNNNFSIKYAQKFLAVVTSNIVGLILFAKRALLRFCFV